MRNIISEKWKWYLYKAAGFLSLATVKALIQWREFIANANYQLTLTTSSIKVVGKNRISSLAKGVLDLQKCFLYYYVSSSSAGCNILPFGNVLVLKD